MRTNIGTIKAVHRVHPTEDKGEKIEINGSKDFSPLPEISTALAIPQQKANDMNPYYMDQMIKEKRRETEAEARRLRLVAIYNAHNPGLGDRLLLALGNTLIRLGEGIKRRHGQPDDLEARLCR